MAELEDLPYEELRHRAFKLAEKRRDVGFFLDLFNHTPAMYDVSEEGGSLGDISGSLIGVIDAAKEAFGHDKVGDLEPLFVARYATYIREHEG
ncbi:MAG: hypothetical protein U0R28_12935 [Candidatus Nanopelagicales bacterium]